MSLLTRKLLSFNQVRLGVNALHSNAALVDNCTEVANKNPRNLELLRIARKPTGFQLERISRKYWHKLEIIRSVQHVEAQIEHFENGPVLTASSKEWPLKKRLYSFHDSAAYINLGRVLAQRCLESGIHAIHVSKHLPKGGKIDLLLSELAAGGVALKEPSEYRKSNPWDLTRPEKPWEVTEP